MKYAYSFAFILLASITQYVCADAPKDSAHKAPTKLSKPVPKTHAQEPVHHAAEPAPGKLVKREPEKAGPKKPTTIKEHITETLTTHSKTGSAPSSADTDNLHKLAQSIKDKDKDISDTQKAHDAATSPAEKKDIKSGLDAAKKHRKTYWEMFEAEVKNTADKVGADAKTVWDDIKRHF